MIQAGDRQFVLRKKPPGQVLASAHAVEREFQVLAALKDTRVPVPKALCLCQDPAVIGTPFYVMEHVQASLPSLTAILRAVLLLGNSPFGSLPVLSLHLHCLYDGRFDAPVLVQILASALQHVSEPRYSLPD